MSTYKRGQRVKVKDKFCKIVKVLGGIANQCDHVYIVKFEDGTPDDAFGEWEVEGYDSDLEVEFASAVEENFSQIRRHLNDAAKSIHMAESISKKSGVPFQFQAFDKNLHFVPPKYLKRYHPFVTNFASNLGLYMRFDPKPGWTISDY